MPSTNNPEDVQDQGFGEFKVDDLLKQISTYNAGVQSTLPAVQDAYSQQQKLSQSTADILNGVASDSSTVSLAASAAQLEFESRKAKVAATFGTDINTDNEYTALAAQAKDAYQRKTQALDNIQQKKSVSLFDDPLQYLVNGFTINKDVADYNIASTQLDSAQSRVKELDTQTQGAMQTQAQLTAGTTQASAAAAARIAASAGTIKANQASIDALSYGVAGIDKANAINKEVYQAMYTGNNAVLAENHYQLALNQNDLANQRFKMDQANSGLENQIRSLTLQDRTDQMQTGKELIAKINTARIARGAGPLPDEGARLVVSMVRGGKDRSFLSTEMNNDLIKGELMQTQGGAQQIIATSPSDYLMMRINKIPINTTPAQKPTTDVMESVANEIANPNKLDPSSLEFSAKYKAAQAAKDPQAMTGLVNERTKAILDSKAANINWQDTSNPYNIGDLGKVVPQSKDISSLPVYQKILAPRVANGEDFSDPQKVFNAIVQGVQDKKITFQEALDTNVMYQLGVRQTLPQKNIQGLSGLAPSLGYKTSIDVAPGKFGSRRIVDMTNYNDLSRAMMLTLNNQSARPFIYHE